MTIARSITINCDGPICVPSEPIITGPLGGAHITIAGSHPLSRVRKLAAETDGWVFDKATGADYCPMCAIVTGHAPEPAAAAAP